MSTTDLHQSNESTHRDGSHESSLQPNETDRQLETSIIEPMTDTNSIIPYCTGREQQKKAMKLYSKIKTPQLPEKVKSAITHQFTMPSYTIMKAAPSDGNKIKHQSRRQWPKEKPTTGRTEVGKYTFIEALMLCLYWVIMLWLRRWYSISCHQKSVPMHLHVTDDSPKN